jgi:hypothetical protein
VLQRSVVLLGPCAELVMPPLLLERGASALNTRSLSTQCAAPARPPRDPRRGDVYLPVSLGICLDGKVTWDGRAVDKQHYVWYSRRSDTTLQDAPCSAMAGMKRMSPLASLATVCRLRWRWSSPCGSSQQSAYHARNGGSNGSNSHRHCSRR